MLAIIASTALTVNASRAYRCVRIKSYHKQPEVANVLKGGKEVEKARMGKKADAHLVEVIRGLLDKTLEGVQALGGCPGGGGAGNGSDNAEADGVKLTLLDLANLLGLGTLKRRSRGSKDKSGSGEETHFGVGEMGMRLGRKMLSKLKMLRRLESED
jgi:hypothetical protein